MFGPVSLTGAGYFFDRWWGCVMGEFSKIVGYITKNVMISSELEEHLNKPILQSLKLYKHTAKHVEDFKNVDSFNNTMANIKKVISNPYFVYYDKTKQSLRYYKYLDEFVCVIVKLTNKKHLYVFTVYPVNEPKIQKLEWEQNREKYEYVENK